MIKMLFNCMIRSLIDDSLQFTTCFMLWVLLFIFLPCVTHYQFQLFQNCIPFFMHGWSSLFIIEKSEVLWRVFPYVGESHYCEVIQRKRGMQVTKGRLVMIN